MKKKLVIVLIAVVCIIALGGVVISSDLLVKTSDTSDDSNDSSSTPETPSGMPTVTYDQDDLNADWDSAAVSTVTLNGNAILFDGTGATVDGTRITITAAGTYRITGTLDDGQIVVETDDAEIVRLILDDASVTCSDSAPLYVMNAEKTVITLAKGTENLLADGAVYAYEDAESDEPNAAVFSKDDLTINGEGSLTVTARYNNGIASKDDLKITGGTITVHAVNDGIKGKDSVAIRDGTIRIEAGGDGIQATNDEKAEKGYVSLEGGTLVVVAGADGIQAETTLGISGGTVTVTSGGGSANSNTQDTWGQWNAQTTVDDSTTSDSAKALKAGSAVFITGGTITIDASDDAVHANGVITINGGTFQISSGDDGMHADTSLEINGGTIDIATSYEGIESAIIVINDGTIHIAARDDGVNVAGGNDGSSVNGRPGQNQFASSGDYYLTINGGYLYVDAVGDGIDVNGQFDMTGGTVLVNGPTNDGNGALDYDGTFTITGGFLVAAGSAGMAQAPGTTSTQYSVMVTYASAQAAETMVHIESAGNEDILTFVPAKTYRSLLVSSPELTKGSDYTVYSGGSATGTSRDGLSSGGVYTPGEQVYTFTVADSVTYVGSSAGGAPGRMVR